MYNPIDLTGRRILITGASSGIGRACSVMCSRLGADVILLARDQARLEETRRLMAEGCHQIWAGDLAQEGYLPTVAQEIGRQTGVFHGIIHAAGILSMAPLRLLDLNKAREVMAINYFAFLELAQCFVRQKGLENGSCVAISSVFGQAGSPTLAAYGGSKGALDSSVRSLALEFAPRRIRFNSIAAAYIHTPLTDDVRNELGEDLWKRQVDVRQPLGLGEPEDVASAATYLLSDAARFITGTTLVVDGGYLAQ